LSTPAQPPAFDGNRRIPDAWNEPIRSYAPGTPERDELKAMLKTVAGERPEIPLIIGGEEIRTDRKRQAVMPHDHGHVLADAHQASGEHVAKAIEAATKAWREWSSWPWVDRAAVMQRAAELLAGPWRARVNAATMLNQSKTVQQAEIDAACELIDFWRFNLQFAEQLYDEQPISPPGVRNTLDYRPLEGFVYAVTPFNFTAIGGNLPTAPAIMGNVALWKPASSSLLSNNYVMRVLEEAGLPPGVINFVPGPAAEISKLALGHSDLAGVHFTGSTEVFQSIWKTVGQSIAGYRSYPRIVGETGGKDFLIAHASADPAALAAAIVRGSFEYQGQKCSALSRIYVSKSIWKDVRDRVTAMMGELVMGDVADFRTFMGAVIDDKAFAKIGGYIEDGRKGAEVLKGGGSDGRQGYFIEPTLIETGDPGFKLMCEEIFGPVVTAYAFDDSKWEETLQVLDRTSPYALTGAIWARDRRAVQSASAALRNAAGNFYVNDKPTGSVVGQQPFGGARASGTNDKAGSKLNLTRWVSARSIKESFVPPAEYRYPNMDAE
jgi:1-pyrroline-5-carboxylate dehydrogenase